MACAEAGVTLISPFVGRIFDWYKKARGVDSIPALRIRACNPVTYIYSYFKKFGHKTEIMGASFRNIGEITELAGCQSAYDFAETARRIANHRCQTCPQARPGDRRAKATYKKSRSTKKTFRWMLNEDAMATEKLAEGHSAL